MPTQPKPPSKLLIPVALLAVLAAGVAVTSPRAAVVSSGQAESKPADSQHDIRARQMIFHYEDLIRDPSIWEKAWELEMPDVTTPYRMHGGVI